MGTRAEAVRTAVATGLYGTASWAAGRALPPITGGLALVPETPPEATPSSAANSTGGLPPEVAQTLRRMRAGVAPRENELRDAQARLPKSRFGKK